jgi:hypothetical protein
MAVNVSSVLGWLHSVDVGNVVTFRRYMVSHIFTIKVSSVGANSTLKIEAAYIFETKVTLPTPERYN